MNRIFAIALAAGVAVAGVASVSPAAARDGCGPGAHRGPYGHCRPNRGGEVVRVGPAALVIGNFYNGRGYWDGHRYWQHRYRRGDGWRYR